MRGGRVLWPQMYPDRDDAWLQEALLAAAVALGPEQRTESVLLRAMAHHARAHHQWCVLSREAGLLLWNQRHSILRLLEIACDALPQCVPGFGLAADEMLLVALATWGDVMETPVKVNKTITSATTLVSFPPSTQQAAAMARWLLRMLHPGCHHKNVVKLLQKHPDAGSRPLRQLAIVADPSPPAMDDADLQLVQHLAEHAEAQGWSPIPINGGYSVYTVTEVARALAVTVRQCAVQPAGVGIIPVVCTAHPITWSSAVQLYVWVNASDSACAKAAGVCGSLGSMLERARSKPVERKQLIVAVRKVAEGVAV